MTQGPRPAVAHDSPGAATAALLRQVTDAAPFLRWRVAPTGESGGPAEPRPDDIACAALARDPQVLGAAVEASGEGRGSDDPQVTASLWWQGYAYRVAGTALACWLLTGQAPDVRAEAMAVGIARHRPSSVTFLDGTGRPTADLGAFHDRLFAGHLDVVAATLRSTVTIGSQLLWGDVAAACASAAGAVMHAAGPDWHQRLTRFTAVAPHGLGALGSWTPRGDGWAFQRRTCCLWWKTSASGGALCSDCSLHRRPGDQGGPA